MVGCLADDETVLFFEPAALDAAIVGLTVPQAGRGVQSVVYDYERLVRAHRAMGMTREEAEEWVDYNTVGAWVGEGTPVVIMRPARGRKG